MLWEFDKIKVTSTSPELHTLELHTVQEMRVGLGCGVSFSLKAVVLQTYLTGWCLERKARNE